MVFSTAWFLEYTIQKTVCPMAAFQAVVETAVEEVKEVDLT